MKFEFIRVEKASHSIPVLCALLGVTRQGYHAWEARKPSQRALAEQRLREDVKRIFDESRGTYGSPRVHAELHREGKKVGKSRVERVMRELDLVARRRRRFVRTTQSDATHPIAPNVLRIRCTSPVLPSARPRGQAATGELGGAMGSAMATRSASGRRACRLRSGALWGRGAHECSASTWARARGSGRWASGEGLGRGRGGTPRGRDREGARRR